MAWHPFRNLWLKAVALLLGTLLWFTVSGQQVERTVSGVPVVYRNKPAALEITEQTQSVDIHVKGIDSQLRSVQPRDFEVRVDLTGASAGELSIPLRTDQVTAPLGIEVAQIEPGSARVVLLRSGAASVPVEPRIEGRPAPGYVVSDVSVDPAAVTIVGPEQRLSSTKSATTERVVIEGATATHTSLVSIGVTDAALRLREPRQARVVVRIEPSGMRQFPPARIVARNLAPGRQASFEPPTVSLSLRGAAGALARVEAGTLSPYVDAEGLLPGRYELSVQLDLAGTLTLGSARPAKVTVTIR